jgi:hypothetical protein
MGLRSFTLAAIAPVLFGIAPALQISGGYCMKD